MMQPCLVYLHAISLVQVVTLGLAFDSYCHPKNPAVCESEGNDREVRGTKEMACR